MLSVAGSRSETNVLPPPLGFGDDDARQSKSGFRGVYVRTQRT